MGAYNLIAKCPCCETILMVKRDKKGKTILVKVESSKTKVILPKEEAE